MSAANTDARRRASAAYHAKREAEGLKKVTLWLGPEARTKLEELKADAGSKDKAAERAILAWGYEPVRPKLTQKPTKPPATSATAPRVADHSPRGAEHIAAPLVVPFAGNLTRKPMQKGSKK